MGKFHEPDKKLCNTPFCLCLFQAPYRFHTRPRGIPSPNAGFRPVDS